MPMERMRCALAALAVGIVIAPVSAATNRVEKTMCVSRCQFVDAKGVQCPRQTDSGERCCWRHRGVAKAVNDFVDDTGKGASETWQSTKRWSTNAWEKTKSGAQSAWDGTKDVANDARIGVVELFGGKDKNAK